jgi:very-short-patch-repair endonuclease
VDVLRTETFEQIQQRSQQHLVAPWALDEQELPDRGRTLYVTPVGGPRPDIPYALWLSPRGAFGQYLRRVLAAGGSLPIPDRETICRQLLEIVQRGALVQAMPAVQGQTGYQLKAAGLRWCAGDGTRAFHDPLRVPNLPEGGGRANPFFLRVYRELVAHYRGIEAREHTAQVPSDERQRREQEFREARLPVLFCSPTMELGVDIAELSVVSLRNVPPTPANYAQRSGRAGRSGQPALVFAYCTTGSPHDQYFFKRPEQMVAGQVQPPRLDLANEDLVRAHVHAVWLAASGLRLGRSLTEVLDLSGVPPTLGLLPSVAGALQDTRARDRARDRAARLLRDMGDELAKADWWGGEWLDHALDRVPLEFERACGRWRTLYQAAYRQRDIQHKIVGDHSRPVADRNRAEQLRREAETQLRLLTDIENLAQSDFYSYRYFASEGFLPGYNFPRLPLSAYIPGRRTRTGRDEFVTRPRFLAISEFGPRAIIYHEGSRYRIHRVILPIPDQPGEETVALTRAKVCVECGYLHALGGNAGPDRCEWCEALLPAAREDLFRLQNVSTRRRDKITCDEEERLRLGYVLRTGVRFAERDGTRSAPTAIVREGETRLVRMSYGPAATLWRFNYGWRKGRQQTGFDLDVERGTWGSNRDDPDDQEGGADGFGARVRRVVPYVEDRRNCLLLAFDTQWPREVMASLQAALKAAIQARFQLEDSELAAEPLPGEDDRRLILLYEAAEGGAGILRRLIDDPDALGDVARVALSLCHFDPQTGVDLRRSPRAKEDCEAACYDCLMSYSNQPDHRLLDRQRVREILQSLASAAVQVSPTGMPRAEHLIRLRGQCESGLERAWLDAIEAGGYRLPSRAQALIEACTTRPDFVYEEQFTVVYVDGPHHEYPDRQQRDRAQQTCLEDAGYTVLRFGDRAAWDGLFAAHPGVFGHGRSA